MDDDETLRTEEEEKEENGVQLVLATHDGFLTTQKMTLPTIPEEKPELTDFEKRLGLACMLAIHHIRFEESPVGFFDILVDCTDVDNFLNIDGTKIEQSKARSDFETTLNSPEVKWVFHLSTETCYYGPTELVNRKFANVRRLAIPQSVNFNVKHSSIYYIDYEAGASN